MASAPLTSAAAARDMGRALYTSFRVLLEKDLDTKPVAYVHSLIDRALRSISLDVTPYLFGSSAVYGYHEPGTDADFVLLSREDVQDGKAQDAASEVAKGLQVDVLAKLMHALQRLDSGRAVWHAELVRRTRVPVLRVKGGGGSVVVEEEEEEGAATAAAARGVAVVDFDITANRRNGVRNSALLRGYFAQQPQTRWLSIAVKQWSKRSGLNMGVEGGCLTSYGFNLMVAYYLLQRNLVQFVSPESCDVAHIPPMPPYLPLDPPLHEGRELGEMVCDFLDFYTHEFNPDEEVVSLSRPGKTLKEELRWTKQAEDMARIRGERTSYRWCIEDPYEVNLNVGRYITPFKIMLLKKHFERARETNMLLDLAAVQKASQAARVDVTSRTTRGL